MTDDVCPKEASHLNKKRVAGGAGIVFLGRLGAIIEATAIIAFTWLYGVTNFGLYATFWSIILIVTPLAQTAMPLALQRFVPRGTDEDAPKAIGFALKWSFFIASAIALLVSLNAEALAMRMEAPPEELGHYTVIIRYFVWALPLWILVEVGTSAIRSLRIFGPEIKVRIMYEQGFRLFFGLSFALIGLLTSKSAFLTYGLFAAHLISVFLAGLFALRLVAKYTDIRAVLRAPMRGELPKAMLKYARPITPAWCIKSLYSELPVQFLNFFLPGTQGLDAAAFYRVARQITSALQMVGITFEYVMAPLAAEKAGQTDHTGLQDMFSFAVRLSTVITLPFCAVLILGSQDILAIMDPAFAGIMTAIIVLAVGRMVETMAGPSTAIVDMLGHRFLPLFNYLMGLLTMTVLSALLIPNHGVTGGAIAAAVGMNVTALLAFSESVFLFKLSPYDRSILRPLLISIGMTSFVVLALFYRHFIPPPTAFIGALSWLFFSLFIVVRYGLTPDDAAALGPLSRFSKRHKKMLQNGNSND